MIRLIVATLLVIAMAAPVAAYQGMGKSHGASDGGFSQLDTDGDGMVSSEEYMEPFARWDADDDGQLSKDEWMAGHGGSRAKGHGMGHGEGHGKTNLDVPMDKIDANGDGAIDAEEFEAQFPSLSKGFGMIDTDKSGAIEAGEWEAFRKSHAGM